MTNKKIVIIYHGNCPDGIVGAWAAWRKFRNKAEYVPLHHRGSERIPKIWQKDVYLIDYTPDCAVVKRLIKENKRVTAIDHHISSRAAAELTQNYSYDENRSGAVLAWKYFHGAKPVPRLLKYIEDCDLWRFKLPCSKEVSAALGDIGLSFKNLDKLIPQFERAPYRKAFIERGKLMLGHDDALIREIVAKNSRLVSFAGRKVLAVNSPLFVSQIGHVLARKNPPLGIIWAEEKNEVKVSLRSDGSVDVAKIAGRFGGGGHRAAAGFTIPRGKKFPWKHIGNAKLKNQSSK